MSVTHSDKLDAIANALLGAQAALKPALKDSTNPFFKSKYADLSSVWDACREALQTHGLSVAQFPGFENGVATLTTVLLHVSGQWMAGTAGAPLAKADAQSAGSVITYLRRYALAAVVGVVQEDDDGQGASRPAARGQKSGAGAKDAVSAPPAAGAKRELSFHGKALRDYTSAELLKIKPWMVRKDPTGYAKELEAIDEILAGREGE